MKKKQSKKASWPGEWENAGVVSSFSHALRAVMLYHQQLGIDPYPASDSLKAFCGLVSSVPELPEAGSRPSASAADSAAEKDHGGRAVLPQAPCILPEEDVAACSACVLCRQRSATMRGRRLAEGEGRVRLLLVGDWLRTAGDESADSTLLFGAAEDLMVEKMLVALKLPFSQVFITNIVKCVLPAAVVAGQDHARQCAGHLSRQIETLKPEYICAMGPLAAKTILQTTNSLALLRRRLHHYRAQGRTIPVVVTYHPGFLLQNQEMKRPTWEDLQFLGRQMGLLG